ncbi:hypothetical protein GTY41_08400 [Streptomyces sp. SID685]|uniref:hypothetical protein n=1 Tax=Streptomyces TaxID=1883 RepID=UPI00136F50D6|nr:hypothetical protein [Streptomyces sp. SID685]MYR84969.1 hypothetical protein [Streptomyces sp. SID685]
MPPQTLYARADAEALTATQLAEQYALQAIDRDGYHPVLAAELSRQHSVPKTSWEYTARKALIPVDPSRGHAGARSTRGWPARTTCG